MVFHRRIVEFHSEVCREVQFAREVPEHALEERVDGLHVEIVVVVYEEREGCRGCFSDVVFRHLCLKCYLFQIVVRFGQSS